jgi:class 3 adenylate cyclase
MSDRHGDRAPSETVTFLFTDLQSSTRLWEGHPEAAWQ